MAFSKSFPKSIDGVSYPKWVEVYLSQQEESNVDNKTRKENVSLMKECIGDAQSIIADQGLNNYQSDVINIAIALFEKRASHLVYAKERLCKDKFDEKNE